MSSDGSGGSGRLLDGWKAVHAAVERCTGSKFGLRTIQRWATREVDPLPTHEGPGGRRMAVDSLLEAWVRRNIWRLAR